MKFLEYLTSSESPIVRVSFALILLVSLISKVYDPSFFMEYISIASQAGSGMQVFVTILYSILEAISIIALLFLTLVAKLRLSNAVPEAPASSVFSWL